ncbi:MAG: site-specific DNA-methyltransferase [Beijerinckiaceae bacterium]|nr:site-specific DNA-methyltransferase [Beijerinckiaceae bacterium]
MPKDASQHDGGIFGPAVEAAEMRPLADLVPYARNSRTHSPEQVDQIVRSMETYGWTVPILVDPDGGVIAGHGRLLAAEKIGWTRVPCLVARGWSEEQKRLYVIADNQLALNADWDEELLTLELGELRAAGFDISLSGFDPDALAALLDPPPERGDPEAVPEVPVVPKSRIGDLYVLGDHRLLCGDATNAADVARLLGDVKPHLMVTDPPYGVEYDPTWREKAGVAGSGAAKGKVLNDDRADWRAAWALFPGDVAYVWHAGLFAGAVGDSLVACDFTLRSQIIWAKSSMVLSRGDYHWQHEPCWYAVRKGKAGHYQGGRKQTTLWPIDKPQKSETGHSTQKPVECMQRPIENNSKRGDAIYEPFSGSGTTIIAGEITGRRVFAMELSPNYVDVAVARWEQFTGGKAELIRAQDPLEGGDQGHAQKRAPKRKQRADA